MVECVIMHMKEQQIEVIWSQCWRDKEGEQHGRGYEKESLEWTIYIQYANDDDSYNEDHGNCIIAIMILPQFLPISKQSQEKL